MFDHPDFVLAPEGSRGEELGSGVLRGFPLSDHSEEEDEEEEEAGHHHWQDGPEEEEEAEDPDRKLDSPLGRGGHAHHSHSQRHSHTAGDPLSVYEASASDVAAPPTPRLLDRRH